MEEISILDIAFGHIDFNEALEEMKRLKKPELLEFSRKAIKTILEMRKEYINLEQEYNQMHVYTNVLRDRLKQPNCVFLTDIDQDLVDQKYRKLVEKAKKGML